MSRFFRKFSLLILFVSLFSVKGSGQILDNANLNLNAGGYINDVIYDQWHDCYIVVGNFTTINSINRRNLAFIDRITMQVKTETYLNPIESMDGEIRCIDFTRTFSFGVFTYHYFIGGNFSTLTVNGSVHNRLGIAKITATQNSLFPYAHSNFSCALWDADLDMYPLTTGFNSQGVEDILITHDTIIFSGAFYAVDMSDTYAIRDGIAAFTINGSSALDYPAVASLTYNESKYFCIRKKGANLFIGGYSGLFGYTGKLRKLDATGNIISAFDFFDNDLRAVYAIELVEDSLLFVSDDRNSDNGGSDCFWVVRQSNGSFKTNHSLSPIGSAYLGGIAPGIKSMTIYENNVYSATNTPGNYVIGVESQGEGAVITNEDWNASVPSELTSSRNGIVHVAANKLFISSINLTTLSGQPKIRFGAYCLPPKTVTSFSIFDTTVCSGQTISYAIPNADFADGYKWEYTGTGAFLVGHGLLTSAIEIDDASEYSNSIEYQSNFNPGVLKITPYSLCNGSTKVYGETISLNIYENPLPHVNAGLDTLLTCANDTLILYGYSDSVVVDYEWVYPSTIDNVIGQYDTISSPDFYVFSATNLLGCKNYDTVLVTENTIQPTATPPPPPYELSCLNPVEDFLGTTTTPNTITEWYQDSITFFPNPISVNTIGTYYFRVTDTLNGCFKDTGIVISNNITPPDIAIVGYPSIGLTLETLTCNLDTLNLTCYSSTPNSTASWINSDTSVFYGDLMTIFEGGFYHIFATNNTNGCTNYLKINIAENFTLHSMTTPADGLLNCSNDSLILSGSSMGAGAVLEWTGSSISPSTNPLAVHDAGWYFLSAENLDNGCKNIDSVLVSQDNSITVFAGNDTLVCNNATVPINATYGGTISGINYLWSNGATNANTNFTAGTQPYAVVQITGDGGCVGTDTVYMNLPPTPVVNFEGFKPCDDGPSGQIVATPVSGIEPFTYSIDNGLNYQSSSVFTGLYIGDYPILVRDSVSCEYNFIATIDENSSLPSPAFLFSTYNFETDTVVIIDISNPPTDSTIWLFPSELIVLDNNPLSPMILLPDTGTFQITMQAYYGNCLVELSKLIYASPFDSLAATQYNLNGIKSIELYPNPTTGNFTVEVEFYKSQRAALVVQDMLANTYVFEEYDESFIITQDIYLDGTVIDGTYVLKIVSEFDSASITFILAR